MLQYRQHSISHDVQASRQTQESTARNRGHAGKQGPYPTSSRASEGLVGGGGDNVGVGEGVLHHPSSHQSGGVSHVCHEVGAHIVCSLAHAGIVVVSGIC